MTEEEEKQEQAVASASNTNTTSKTTTTTKEGSTKTISGGESTQKIEFTPTNKVSRNISWRFNPESGETNNELVDQFNTQVSDYEQTNYIDPTTKQTDRKHLSSLLGFDPQVNKKRREEQEALARRKQKEAAWFNGVSILADMLTTAIGGNVQQQEAYKGGAEAKQEIEKLQDEQMKENILVNESINKNNKAYTDYVDALEKQYQTLFGGKVDKSTPSTKTITKTTDDKTIYTSPSEQTKTITETGDKSGKSSSSSNRKKQIIAKDAKGEPVVCELGKETYDALVSALKAYYTKILMAEVPDSATDEEKDKIEERQETLEQKLFEHGILIDKPKGSTKNQYKWNDDMVLQNGYFFMLDKEMKDKIKGATKGKIKFD
jgi:hypothetical protein